MRALCLNCTLKPGPEPSNTEAFARVLLGQLEEDGADCELVRLVDLDIRPGVEADMGEGDAWPEIRQKIAAADIVIVATPTWLGQASSVCQRALERMDAMLSESDDDGRPAAYGKVAGVVITGNEDGAHHIVGTTCQALIDIGFAIPGQSWAYWHLGPGPGPNYLDTDEGRDYAHRIARNAARNLSALARLLTAERLPIPETAE
jgi:multimeric flavodoxin WrbA